MLDDGDQATKGPLVLTFNDIVTSDGIPGAQVDTGGIFFGRDPVDFAVVSMTMTFNLDVILTAYDIDFFFPSDASPSAGSFQILGPGGTATGAMTLFPGPSSPARIPFDMGTIGTFEAGVAYSFTHTVMGTDVGQIDEFDFQLAAIHLPAGGALLGATLLGVGAFRQRRKHTEDPLKSSAGSFVCSEKTPACRHAAVCPPRPG